MPRHTGALFVPLVCGAVWGSDVGVVFVNPFLGEGNSTVAFGRIILVWAVRRVSFTDDKKEFCGRFGLEVFFDERQFFGRIHRPMLKTRRRPKGCFVLTIKNWRSVVFAKTDPI